MEIEPAPYRLFLELAGKHWINANERLYWMEKHKRTKAWREQAALKARAAKIPRLERVHIVCKLRFGDNRRRDPGNWAPTAKAIVDGLVDAHVVPDDNHKHVRGPDMRLGIPVVGAAIGVWVYIYPLGDEDEDS